MQTKKIKYVTFSIIFILVINSMLLAFASDFKTLYRAGEKAFAGKNYKSAVVSFKKAVMSRPDGTRAKFRLGQSLYYLNNFSESYTQFQQILTTTPNNIPARIFLIKDLIALKKNKEAKMQLKWILKVQPEFLEAKTLLKNLSQPKQNNWIIAQKDNDGPEEIPVGFKPLPVNNVQQIDEIKPYVANDTTKKANVKKRNPNPHMPAAMKVGTWNVKKFLSMANKSFGVSLEYAKYCIEKGDLDRAEKYLNISFKLSRDMTGVRKQYLEARILSCLVSIYKEDFESFGKKLLSLKSVLSAKSYQSFLDIYNRAKAAKSNDALTKLSAGVAMGAGHFRVAMKLFEKNHYAFPDDKLIANMLIETQIQCREYDSAEKTMLDLARRDPRNYSIFFNLAKFYLTAKYNPELSYKYAVYAQSLNDKDIRLPVLYALLEYSQGKIDTGIARLKQLLPQVHDEQFKHVCLKLIRDGNMANARNYNNSIDFAKVLALPGSSNSPISSYNVLGEESLKRGLFFSAMKYFSKANDMAEIGRTYLGLASMLAAMGDKQTAALAAGFGKKALLDELVNNPNSGRANLYMALYSFERKDLVSAKKAIESGLKSNCKKITRKRLMALLRQIES